MASRNARGAVLRARKLQALYAAETPCQCVTIADPIDWTAANLQEMRRFIELSKAAELLCPVACETCGKKTVTTDKSRLSTADQIELQAIALAVRERANERAKETD
jgi:hypothetical protein